MITQSNAMPGFYYCTSQAEIRKLTQGRDCFVTVAHTESHVRIPVSEVIYLARMHGPKRIELNLRHDGQAYIEVEPY